MANKLKTQKEPVFQFKWKQEKANVPAQKLSGRSNLTLTLSYLRVGQAFCSFQVFNCLEEVHPH